MTMATVGAMPNHSLNKIKLPMSNTTPEMPTMKYLMNWWRSDQR